MEKLALRLAIFIVLWAIFSFAFHSLGSDPIGAPYAKLGLKIITPLAIAAFLISDIQLEIKRILLLHRWLRVLIVAFFIIAMCPFIMTLGFWFTAQF